MRRRPGRPNEMRSDVPSHVTSVRATITATRAMVRRRGTVPETYSLGRFLSGRLGVEALAGGKPGDSRRAQPRLHAQRLPPRAPFGDGYESTSGRTSARDGQELRDHRQRQPLNPPIGKQP